MGSSTESGFSSSANFSERSTSNDHTASAYAAIRPTVDKLRRTVGVPIDLTLLSQGEAAETRFVLREGCVSLPEWLATRDV